MDEFHAFLSQLLPHLPAQGNTLARSAANVKAISAFFQEIMKEHMQGGYVQGFIGVQGGDQGGHYAFKFHHCSSLHFCW